MSPIRYGSTNCLFLPMCTLNGDRRHTASISQFQRETQQRILVDAMLQEPELNSRLVGLLFVCSLPK